MFLTEEEIVDLTGKRRHDAQARALRFMGIEFKPRPDGSLAVLRAHVERVLGGVLPTERERKKTEPNWAALEEWERRKAERKAKK